jgi:hypothetical protein
MPESEVERQPLSSIISGALADQPGNKDQPIEETKYVTRAGVWIAWGVIAVIVVFTLAILSHWMWTALPITVFGNPVTAESLALYQKARDAAFQQVTSLIDMLVLKAFIPILTLILGYIFGTQVDQGPKPK